MGLCIALLLIALFVAAVVVHCKLSFDGYQEGYRIWGPGYYPGYWGYRVPPWKRRWWWRRRYWGVPLRRYARPWYYR